MIMQDNEKKPALRFKGFTDPWEQRKLAELTKTITTGKSVNSDEGEVSDGNIGVLKTSCVSYDRFNPSESKPVVKSEQQLVKCAVEKDSVIVSRMNTPERVGACGYVSTDFPNLFLPDRLWKLKFQDTVDTYFVYMMLVSSAYKEKITSMASGTSGSMYNIPKETFLNLQLVIPAKIDEQKQLGKILKKIDTLITLHQRKYEKLVNIKKSMLDKMFPQNGASVPEIRFKSFTDPWEQRKFSDITFPAGEKNRDNLPLESYSITNEHGFIPQDEKFENGGTMREADKRMYYIVSPNSFAYNPARINVGSIGYQNTGKDVIVSSLYEVFKTSDDVDDRLLWHWFKSPDFQKLIFQLQEGGVRLYFYYDKLCMGTVSLPSLEEQRKIGQFFDSLDTLITLHQREHIKSILEVKRVKRNE